MRSDKNLYYVQLSANNSIYAIARVKEMVLSPEDQCVEFDPCSFLLYTQRSYNDLRTMIGLDLIDEVDDFMVMRLDYDMAMSIFTDSYDIIDFLRMVRDDTEPKEGGVSESEVNALLDKVLAHGKGSLSKEEIGKLKKF